MLLLNWTEEKAAFTVLLTGAPRGKKCRKLFRAEPDRTIIRNYMLASITLIDYTLWMCAFRFQIMAEDHLEDFQSEGSTRTIVDVERGGPELCRNLLCVSMFDEMLEALVSVFVE